MLDQTEPSTAVLPVSRVHRTLRRRVLGGDYQPGQKLPAEREFGEEFGVSRLTVAKAMAKLVSEGLVNRHRGRGTFVNAQVGSGRNGGGGVGQRTRVTFISPGAQNEGVVVRRGVLEGLHAILGQSGYDVAVDFYETPEQHLKCLDRYREPQSAAFAIWPSADPEVGPRIEAMLAENFPLVLVDTYLPGLDCDYVVSDNVEGATQMVQHLVALGHRRLVYLTETLDRSSLRDRLTGYLRGAIYAGLPTGAATVVQAASREPSDVAAAVGRALDERDSRSPMALLTSHDDIAMAAYRALRERGMRVPEDISLAGYDDIDAAQHFTVPLTTIRQDYFEIGRVTGRILLERLRGGPGTVRYQKLIHPNLRIRQSTAAPGGIASSVFKSGGEAEPADHAMLTGSKEEEPL